MNRIAAVSSRTAPVATSDARVRRSRAVGVGSAAAVLIALMLIAYATLWAVASLNLRTGVLDWIAARQAEGYRIDYTALDLGGFPLAARVTVLGPVVTAPDGRTLGWSWAGGRAAFEASPFRYDGLTLRLAGDEALSINIDGKLKTYRGGAEELTLRTAGGLMPQSGELTVRGLAMAADEPGDGIMLERLTATGALRKPVSAVPGADSLLAIRIDAAGVKVPQQLQLPLGDTISQVSAGATVNGVLHSFTNPRDALARWRDAGGAVNLARFGVHYGELKMNGAGTFSLDAALQPVGAFTARIEGFQQTIAALSDRGIIDVKVASKARMAMAVLSRREADGSPPSLQLPLTIRDRILSIGPLPLLAVPEIEWPRGPNPNSSERPAFAVMVPG